MSAKTPNPEVNPDSLPPGAVVGGSWRLLERLGMGGYGAVYRVESINRPGQYFALKLARHPYDTRAVRELTLLMDKAVHPNVVAVHACGRWPDIVSGLFYFVMDWVPGPPLHLWADFLNPTFQQLADAARRVALVLQALHAGGVLHRDLKPEHILLRAPHGDPVLIDLGAGDYEGAPTLTTTPLPPGTRHLRSPEAVRFHQRHWRRPAARYPFAPTDDLYALGICLYRATTGHYPFSPDWDPDVLYAAISSREPPPPSAINPRVPPALDAVILGLLEKAPSRRFQSGAQLHEALDAALKESPREPWEAPIFEWYEPAATPAEGYSLLPRRVRLPEWPPHVFRPPSAARAKLLRVWEELLGLLRPPPRPHPRSRPGQQLVLEGSARRLRPGRRRKLLAAVGVAAVAGLLAVGARASEAWRNTTVQVAREATTAIGQKVASPPEAPQTGRAAAPPPAEPTPAAAPVPVAPPQEAAPVTKTPDVRPAPAPEKKPAPKPAPPRASLARKASAAALCTVGMACASTPPLVRQQQPPPEDCPPGAVEAMKKLEIEPGDILTVDLIKELEPRDVTVREGRATLYTAIREGLMPRGTEIYGQLFIGEQRVYGRFTSVLVGNEQYPVCFELYEVNVRQLGDGRLPGGDSENAVLTSKQNLRVTSRFR